LKHSIADKFAMDYYGFDLVWRAKSLDTESYLHQRVSQFCGEDARFFVKVRMLGGAGAKRGRAPAAAGGDKDERMASMLAELATNRLQIAGVNQLGDGILVVCANIADAIRDRPSSVMTEMLGTISLAGCSKLSETLSTGNLDFKINVMMKAVFADVSNITSLREKLGTMESALRLCATLAFASQYMSDAGIYDTKAYGKDLTAVMLQKAAVQVVLNKKTNPKHLHRGANTAPV
jgi:hypothetical protein